MPTDTRLNQALALLRGDGNPRWTKLYFHHVENGAVTYCLVGAMEKVAKETKQSRNELNADREAVRAVILEQFSRRGIFAFNDDPRTTFQDIELVLEKALAKRQEQI